MRISDWSSDVCSSDLIVILGKQAIDDDCNQTGQMLSALLGWSQATFASKIEIGDGALTVTREVDGGLEPITVQPPRSEERRAGKECVGAYCLGCRPARL